MANILPFQNTCVLGRLQLHFIDFHLFHSVALKLGTLAHPPHTMGKLFFLPPPPPLSHTHAHAHTHVCTHRKENTSTHLHVYICAQTPYTHVHTHTHTHTHLYTWHAAWRRNHWLFLWTSSWTWCVGFVVAKHTWTKVNKVTVGFRCSLQLEELNLTRFFSSRWDKTLSTT